MHGESKNSLVVTIKIVLHCISNHLNHCGRLKKESGLIERIQEAAPEFDRYDSRAPQLELNRILKWHHPH